MTFKDQKVTYYFCCRKFTAFYLMACTEIQFKYWKCKEKIVIISFIESDKCSHLKIRREVGEIIP